MHTQNLNKRWFYLAVGVVTMLFAGVLYAWSILKSPLGGEFGWGASELALNFTLAMSFFCMGGLLGARLSKALGHKVALACAGILSALGFGLTASLSGSSVWMLYLTYGVLAGAGIGIAYNVLIATVSQWFPDKKGLCSGCLMMGFGASALVLGNVANTLFQSDLGWRNTYILLGGLICAVLILGGLLLKKPDDWHEPQGGEDKPSIMAVIKTRPITNYIGIWLMFYINITCGLALLSQEKAIVKCLGLASVVGIISTLSAVFNAGGRLAFSAWADKLKDRNTIYKLIFVISIVLTALVIVTGGIANGAGNGLLIALVLALIMMVNAGYGGGFSNVPTLLSDHYGMGSISALHGITLSAWAFAGLSGNQLATWIVSNFGEEVEIAGNVVNPTGYQMVLYVTIVLYIVALLLSMFFVRPNKEKAD